jgi:hypothetical protein
MISVGASVAHEAIIEKQSVRYRFKKMKNHFDKKDKTWSFHY